jgi:hypothetical protein
MKAVIIFHTQVVSVDESLCDQFVYYHLYCNDRLLHEDVLTFPTAQVFAEKLEWTSAFMSLITAIASAGPGDFAALVGALFGIDGIIRNY